MDFESLYSPVRKGSGIDKVEQTFQEVLELTQHHLVDEMIQDTTREKLQTLHANLITKRDSFRKNLDKHVKFLPENTILNASESSGTHEQVLELHMTQQIEIEKQAEPENEEKPIVNNRSYLPVDLTTLEKPNFRSNSFLEVDLFLLLISPEAHAIYQSVSTVQGNALFYIVVSRDDNSSIGLITRTDFHEGIIKGSPRHVFSPTQEDFFQIYFYNDCRCPMSNQLRFNLALARLYMGYTQFHPQDIELLKPFAKHLEESLKLWAQSKGTRALRSFITDTLLS